MRPRYHEPRHHLGGSGIAPILAWIGDVCVGQAMLVVDGDHGQPLLPASMAREGLEVGNHEIDLFLVDQVVQARDTCRGLPCGHQILRNCSPVAHLIVHIFNVPTGDLGNIKILAQVGQPTVKRDDMHPVSAPLKVSDDFLGPRRVPRAFAVDAVENVRHGYAPAEFDRGLCSIKTILKRGGSTACGTLRTDTHRVRDAEWRDCIKSATKSSKLESDMNLIVYSGPGCPDCRVAKRFLVKHNLPFTEIDIETTPGAADEVVQRTGKRAIPQFVIDGEWVQPYRPGEGFLYEEMAERLGVSLHDPTAEPGL